MGKTLFRLLERTNRRVYPAFHRKSRHSAFAKRLVMMSTIGLKRAAPPRHARRLTIQAGRIITNRNICTQAAHLKHPWYIQASHSKWQFPTTIRKRTRCRTSMRQDAKTTPAEVTHSRGSGAVRSRPRAAAPIPCRSHVWFRAFKWNFRRLTPRARTMTSAINSAFNAGGRPSTTIIIGPGMEVGLRPHRAG